MARLPYALLDAGAIQPLVHRIVAERGSVLHLYRMLLHSPPLAEGWLALMTAVRQRCELRADLRELVIVRIAQLNRAPYEADQHRPLALREGLGADQLDALERWRDAGDLFDPLQRDVLALADGMTREVQVDAALIQRLGRQLGERALVELVATVASYNMVSRFLEALQIHSDDQPDAAPAAH
jgi:AhpD family alkylhydroperoxidase